MTWFTARSSRPSLLKIECINAGKEHGYKQGRALPAAGFSAFPLFHVSQFSASSAPSAQSAVDRMFSDFLSLRSLRPPVKRSGVFRFEAIPYVPFEPDVATHQESGKLKIDEKLTSDSRCEHYSRSIYSRYCLSPLV